MLPGFEALPHQRLGDEGALGVVQAQRNMLGAIELKSNVRSRNRLFAGRQDQNRKDDKNRRKTHLASLHMTCRRRKVLTPRRSPDSVVTILRDCALNTFHR